MNTNLVLTQLSSWRSLWSRQARSRKKDKAWWRSSRCQSSWCRRSREGSGSSRWNWKVDSSYDFCLILLIYFLYQIEIKSQEQIKGKYLQSWEDKHDGKVDLDDHGDILVGEAVDHLAQEHQHASRQGHLDISCFHARNLFCSPWENLRRQVGQGWPQQQRLASRPTGLSTLWCS